MHHDVALRPFNLLLSAVAKHAWLRLALIALPLVHVLAGLPTKEIHFELDGTKARPNQGYAYAWSIPNGSGIWNLPTDTMRHPSASTLRLYENGQFIGRPHTPHADIASIGNGSYSYWDHMLVFAPRDNSDPRTNGHRYHATAEATLPRPIAWLLITLIYLGGLVAVFGYVIKKPADATTSDPSALHAPGQHLASLFMARTFGDIGRVGLVFAPLALALSLLVAPYLSVDSQVLAAFTLNDFVVPHFPFGYPFFVRTINFLSGLVVWPLTWQAPSFYQPQYSGTSLRVLMLAQHTLAILAAAYFAVTVARSFWPRVAIAAIIYFQPSMLVFTHSVLTEGPAFALLVAAAAELVKFSRFNGRHRSALVRFYVFIGVAAVFKHVFIVFAGMPLGCVLLLLLNRQSRARIMGGQPRTDARFLTVGLVGVAIISHALDNQAMRLIGVEPRSSLGRPFVYRLAPKLLQEHKTGYPEHQFFRSEEERRSILHALKDHAQTATQRHVIDIMGQTPNPWVGPWNAVERLVATQCVAEECQRHSWAAADALMNSVARSAILSLDWRLWRDAALRTVQFISPAIVDPGRALSDARFYSTHCCFELRVNESVTGLGSATLASYRWQLGRDLGRLISAKATVGELGALPGMAVVIFMIFVLKRGHIISVTLLMSALVYSVAVSIVTIYLRRYGDVVALLAVLAAIVATLEMRPESSGPPRGLPKAPERPGRHPPDGV